MTKALKIVWAIDPYNTVEKIDTNLKTFFEEIQKQRDVEIRAVYVETSYLQTYRTYAGATSEEEISNCTKRDVDEYLNQFKGINVNEVILLKNQSGIKRNEVDTLNHYLNTSGADCVVLSSHGRTGYARLALGSFAENLVLKARVPLFIINSEMKSKIDLSRALLPVELEDEAMVFANTVFYSKPFDFIKHYHLYHNVGVTEVDYTSYYPGFFIPQDQSYEYYCEQAVKESNDFMAEIAAKSKPDKEIDYSTSRETADLTELIRLKTELCGAGLIVMKSNTGPTGTFFFGSRARDIVRKSTLPTLIYPYKFHI